MYSRSTHPQPKITRVRYRYAQQALEASRTPANGCQWLAVFKFGGLHLLTWWGHLAPRAPGTRHQAPRLRSLNLVILRLLPPRGAAHPAAHTMPSVLAAAATAAAFQHRQLMGGGGPPGPPPVPGPTCLELGVPCGLTQGVVCDQFPSEVEWTVDEAAGFRYINSNSIPAFPVLDYCPFGIGGLYCGEYKSCPSGEWGQSGELCVPEGSGMVLDPNRPGADWGTVATAVDDCPQASWETMTCPQQGTETIGDCMDPSWRNWQFPLRPRPSSQEAGPKAYPGQGHGMGLDGVPIDGPTEAGLAVGESSVILLHPPLHSAGVSIRMERGCRQTDSLADGARLGG